MNANIDLKRGMPGPMERYSPVDDEFPVLIVDCADGAIVGANDAAGLFYGYGRDEMTAMRIDAINEAPLDSILSDLRVALSGGTRSMLFRHRLADGRDAQVVSTVSPVGFDAPTLVRSVVQNGNLLAACRDERGSADASGSAQRYSRGDIDHIVKNNLQILDSLLGLSLDAEADRPPDDVLLGIRRKIQILASVYDFSMHDEELSSIALAPFAETVLDNVARTMGVEAARSRIRCDAAIRIDISVANSIGFLMDYMFERVYSGVKERPDGDVDVSIRGTSSSFGIVARGPRAGTTVDSAVQRQIAQAVASRLGVGFEAGDDGGGSCWMRCRVDRDKYRMT